MPEVYCELTNYIESGLGSSRRPPPNDTACMSDSRSPALNPFDMTGSSDLFSSLVSLDTDDRCALIFPSHPFAPAQEAPFSSCFTLLIGKPSRHLLSQEFVENLGVLGDINMDPVEFQNLFMA